MYKITCLLALFIISQANYKKVTPKVDPDAVCLDGSPSALYVSKGAESKKLLIFFLGGGVCAERSGTAATLKACLERSQSILGSSTKWPDTIDDFQGYLSVNASKNPTFANWTKFFFIYCDGMLHQGHRQQPVPYNGSKLYFRGDKITKSHFKWIDTNYGLFTNATDVVITGGSAGGIATFLWTNYLQKLVKGKVHTIIDSGVFANQRNHITRAYDFQELTKSVFKTVNGQIGTPFAECNAAHPQNQYQCLIFQYAFPYLTGRSIVVNSNYDAWGLPNIIGVTCVKGNDLSGCNTNEMKAIDQYHTSYLKILTEYLLTPNSNAWSIACVNHVYLTSEFYFISPLEVVPAGSGNTAEAALAAWMQGSPIKMVDLVKWPDNLPCAHLKNVSRMANM